MWLLLAFLSATLLGFYDVFKKKSLKDNAVLPVLFLNTFFSSLIFLPFILISVYKPDLLGGTIFNVPVVGWEQHKYIIIKSFIVLSSWIFGYFGMKHLPLTIVGPINATRPVMVLVGAMLVFGERLNLYQWIGVMLAIVSFFMLSRSGKKEGIDFKHNKWIFFIVLAAITGAISGLYDKYLMKSLNPMLVQSWYNVYQVFIMCPILLLLWWPKRKSTTPFRWDWTIILISIFLSAADFVYFYALSYDDSMISIVSMVRRGSVVVSFTFGALLFREKNLKSKAIDLILFSAVGLFASTALWAQEAKTLFVNMPDSLSPLLTKVNREDCIDFLESKMKAQVENRFGKKSEMTDLSKDYIRMQMSSQSTWQMKVLALNDSTNVICTVSTACAPACDSSIRFYTDDWKPLTASLYITLPVMGDFLNTPDSAGVYEFDEARRSADILLMKADFNKENTELTVTLATPDYMSTETAEKLKPFLRRPIVYHWKNGAFTK